MEGRPLGNSVASENRYPAVSRRRAWPLRVHMVYLGWHLMFVGLVVGALAPEQDIGLHKISAAFSTLGMCLVAVNLALFAVRNPGAIPPELRIWMTISFVFFLQIDTWKYFF